MDLFTSEELQSAAVYDFPVDGLGEVSSDFPAWLDPPTADIVSFLQLDKFVENIKKLRPKLNKQIWKLVYDAKQIGPRFKLYSLINQEGNEFMRSYL